MTEENSELMRRLIGCFSGSDPEAALVVVSEDYVDHQGEHAETNSGRGGFGRMVNGLRTAFPDLQVEIEDLIANGDRVVARLRWRGTFMGDLWGTRPTGAHIEAESIEIVRFVDGIAVEHWGLSQGWP